jgi:hypothetical protein
MVIPVTEVHPIVSSNRSSWFSSQWLIEKTPHALHTAQA